MKIFSKKEQLIYDNAGGGERGESAVKKYREYIKEHYEWLSREMKAITASGYSPTNEKDTATSPLTERR